MNSLFYKLVVLLMLISTSCSVRVEPEVQTLVINEVEKEYSGYVTFWLDDGYESTYKIVLPEFENRGWKAAIAVLADREYASEIFYPKDIISWDQLETLESSGWEISNHSMHHLHLNKEDPRILEEEIVESLIVLQDLGFEIDSFTFPYGEQGGVVGQKYIKDNHSYWRSSQCGINELPAWRHLLSYPITSNTTKSEIEKWITEAENNGWLIINLHDIAESPYDSWDQSIEQFNELLRMIEESNLQVVIPEQIYSKYGYAETNNGIRIEKIGVNAELKMADIQDGEWNFSELEEYPLWISSTPSFGNPGLSAIIGHRQWIDTPKVFVDLDKLRAGDIITVNDFEYSVQYAIIVEPEEIYTIYDNLNELFYEDDISGIMLITCTPYGTSLQRLLIIAEKEK